MRKSALPPIVGVFLGTISVLMGQIPPAAALWSGMVVLGNHFGYVLGALIVAYFNTQNWKRSFWTSTLTIIIATVVYYVLIEILGVLGIAEYVVFEGIGRTLIDIAMWSAIGAIVGALSATAMWVARHGKTALLRVGALAAAYAAVLWVLWFSYGGGILAFYRNFYIKQDYLTGYFGGRNFAGDLFETAFAFVTATVLFAVAAAAAVKRETGGPRRKGNRAR